MLSAVTIELDDRGQGHNAMHTKNQPKRKYESI